MFVYRSQRRRDGAEIRRERTTQCRFDYRSPELSNVFVTMNINRFQRRFMRKNCDTVSSSPPRIRRRERPRTLFKRSADSSLPVDLFRNRLKQKFYSSYQLKITREQRIRPIAVILVLKTPYKNRCGRTLLQTSVTVYELPNSYLTNIPLTCYYDYSPVAHLNRSAKKNIIKITPINFDLVH